MNVKRANRKVAMQANKGDRVIIRHQSGQPDRDGEVLEVRGANGAPPYVVRWEDSGHETYFFPGPDATIQYFRHVAT
jgi:hypothetical protein